MKLFAVLLGALALAAGFTGGLRAYSASSQAGPPVPAAQVSVHHYPPAQVVRPGPIVRWAPCVKPAVKVGRACVTRVTHTVTLPASTVSTPPVTTASAPATQTPSPPAATPHSATTHSTGGHRHHHHHGDGSGDD